MLTESHSIPLAVKNGLETSESDSTGLRDKLNANRKNKYSLMTYIKGRIDFYLFPEKMM